MAEATDWMRVLVEPCPHCRTDAVEGDEWDRRGTRRGAEPLTVAGLARFTRHELVHHRQDAESRLAV